LRVFPAFGWDDPRYLGLGPRGAVAKFRPRILALSRTADSLRLISTAMSTA